MDRGRFRGCAGRVVLPSCARARAWSRTIRVVVFSWSLCLYDWQSGARSDQSAKGIVYGFNFFSADFCFWGYLVITAVLVANVLIYFGILKETHP